MHSHFPGPASSDPPPTLCTRRGRKLPKRRRTNSLSTPMLQGGHRLSKLWRSPITPLFNLCHRLLINFKFSSLSQAKGLDSLDEECEEFLPWLERKAGVEISSVLSIGKSAYGRSLFASEIIRTGDCISKVPYSQITPDNLLPKIKALLSNKVGTVAKLAIILLVEQKMGQDSEWASYISCLPQHGEIHSTIFWSEYELDMIRQSSVYQETINQKSKIEEDFAAVVPVLEQFPEIFESITLKDFMRAYFLVTSRAWESTKGLSLIPFTDFMNHDGVSDSIVLFDEDKKLSEVIADRNYVPGQEVLINYGNFPNATLPLDFGFTLPYNIHDQVQIHFNIPYHDCLREMKLELLQQHSTPKLKDAINCSEDTFLIKEVRSPRGKGKGLPQSLRAFARVLCCTAPEELSDLAMEAAQMDGRLARQPLKDSRRELLAHEMLLSHITHLMQKYDVAIKSLAPANFPSMSKKFALRRQMAHDLLTGELRVLNSASAWLNNYCAALRATIHCQSQ
ncbi:ribulose-1,5 bisphosphate carboxylase/oxygenase large subunit N-methyltransferase, chloroplastic isoform X2 [Herrania umbratica]|uniref:Ribulose-1,5 bisphosphate carboxylase/oxygenase large subunit N-methyltransferase, chloroplastic isoform X2 n=1 Tax=Herrania umbratica TaxID=108875 RepID=A0A6J1B867_9ROSI|nr:ribulose-1,5 bisphosphate carboxylase/oxygenase large subunit N-methyltransferase, chloroplastic isoform X2 [Herrania umbratica]